MNFVNISNNLSTTFIFIKYTRLNLWLLDVQQKSGAVSFYITGLFILSYSNRALCPISSNLRGNDARYNPILWNYLYNLYKPNIVHIAEI